jgi:hypothetical protein
VVGFNFNDGLLLASGWEGVVKVARVEDLPQFNKTLGAPHRHIWNVKMCDAKAYVLLRIDGCVCVEVSFSINIVDESLTSGSRFGI